MRDATTVVGEPLARRVGAYVLGAKLGVGGMGVVYAGRDEATGREVAIKLMRSELGGAAGEQRFLREVQALAGLRHPAIVEYIDHGVTVEGHAYLVMERLTGEDLAERLPRGALAIAECVELGLRLAEGLVVAHGHGVVHRDLKPSNVYLPERMIDRAKVLDFGVARVRGAAHSLTRTGAMVGTVGFMAPEQARGEPNLDGRADLYSLGCILHECLTGVPLFTGDHPMAVLAKILLDEVPRVRERRPEVSLELDQLIADLLAREREDRPPDAEAVVRGLAGLAPVLALAAEPVSGGGVGVTLREQRVFCLLLLRSRDVAIDPLAETGAGESMLGESLARLAAGFGAVYSPMLGGYGLVSVQLAAPAGDVAAQVARCALAIRRQVPTVAQVMVTGRGQSDGVSFVGRVVDSALRIDGAAAEGEIVIDEASAGLLGEQFEVVRGARQVVLVGEREAPAVRLLLGRPAPFVGRARELAWLEGLVREACEESRSSAVLVTAGPGGGKSRLRVELVRSLRAGGLEPLVLLGRGTPMSRGAALEVLRPAIRREVGVVESEPREQQRARLRRRIAETVVARDCARVEAFLGEICGVHFADEHHPSLPLARRDASVMADATRLAWLDWLRAEAGRRPVLLVLEDLHWGDAASVMFAEAALRELSALPLVVLGLARPEVHALFRGLWSERAVAKLELPPISARSSEMLVRQVLGASADELLVASLVVRADGNPFFLEELIRAAASGDVGQLPDTVLGVVQARVERLDDESRRTLRAASVFGEEFSEAALATVLGAPGLPPRARLAALIQQEFLARELRPDAVVYRFRHALVREASYAMLTDEDRLLAHRLAAAWLAEQDGQEPMAVAGHYLRAELPREALGWFRLAAGAALVGSDLGAAVERAEQAIECGAEGEVLAELRLIQAEARIWAGNLEDAERWAGFAVEGLPVGTRRWFTAVQRSMYCASVRGDQATVRGLLARAEPVQPAAQARFGPLLCLCEALYAAFVGSDAVWMTELTRRIEAQVVGVKLPGEVMAQVLRARTNVLGLTGRHDVAVGMAARAADEFEAAGDMRNAVRMRVVQGHALLLLGVLGPAEEVLRGLQAVATRLGAEQTSIYALSTLAEVCIYGGRFAESRAFLDEAARRNVRRGDPRIDGAIEISNARLELREGRLELVEQRLQRAFVLVKGQPALEMWGYAVQARVALARGDRGQASGLARRLAEMLHAGASSFFWEAYVSLAIVECLDDAAERREALEQGLGRLRRVLGRIADPERRGSLLGFTEWRGLVVLGQQYGLAVDDLALAAEA